MALTMINPTSSWIEVVELPVVTQLHRQTVNGKKLLTAEKIFDKTSDPCSIRMNKRSTCVTRCIAHHDGILTWNEPSPQQRVENTNLYF
jgi:hypothetical protein